MNDSSSSSSKKEYYTKNSRIQGANFQQPASGGYFYQNTYPSPDFVYNKNFSTNYTNLNSSGRLSSNLMAVSGQNRSSRLSPSLLSGAQKASNLTLFNPEENIQHLEYSKEIGGDFNYNHYQKGGNPSYQNSGVFTQTQHYINPVNHSTFSNQFNVSSSQISHKRSHSTGRFPQETNPPVSVQFAPITKAYPQSTVFSSPTELLICERKVIEPIAIQSTIVEHVPVQPVPVIVNPPVQIISRYEPPVHQEENCSKYKLKIEELEEKIRLLESQHKTEKASLEKEIFGLKEKKTLLESEKTILEKDKFALENEIISFKAKMLNMISIEQYQEANEKVIILTKEISSWRSKLESAEALAISLESRINELRGKKKVKSIKIKNQVIEIEELKRRIFELEQALILMQQEVESTRLAGRANENELIESRRKITTITEEYSHEINIWREKVRILSEEIVSLQDENTDLQGQVEMYKKKYVEYSNITDRLNNSLSLYVIMSAQLEALKKASSSVTEQRKSRNSIVEQLAALDGGSQRSVTRVVKETVEYE